MERYVLVLVERLDGDDEMGMVSFLFFRRCLLSSFSFALLFALFCSLSLSLPSFTGAWEVEERLALAELLWMTSRRERFRKVRPSPKHRHDVSYTCLFSFPFNRPSHGNTFFTASDSDGELLAYG